MIGNGILTKLKLIQAFIVFLLICKYDEDPFKIETLERSQHFSHYKSMGIFPDAQGQVTHKSFVGYCSVEPIQDLWLSSLPARLKKNQSKMKELDWSQGFPHYNPKGAICCHENQSSNPIRPKTLCRKGIV